MKVKRFNNISELCAVILQFETPMIREVDEGIGVYEYWGAKGVDRQRTGEVEEMPEITLELLLPEGYTLNMLHFDTFISDILTELDEAAHTIEMIAKDRACMTAEEYNKPDYSDIIKLCYWTAIHTHSCSTKIHKLVFTFNWENRRF